MKSSTDSVSARDWVGSAAWHVFLVALMLVIAGSSHAPRESPETVLTRATEPERPPTVPEAAEPSATPTEIADGTLAENPEVEPIPVGAGEDILGTSEAGAGSESPAGTPDPESLQQPGEGTATGVADAAGAAADSPEKTGSADALATPGTSAALPGGQVASQTTGGAASDASGGGSTGAGGTAMGGGSGSGGAAGGAAGGARPGAPTTSKPALEQIVEGDIRNTLMGLLPADISAEDKAAFQGIVDNAVSQSSDADPAAAMTEAVNHVLEETTDRVASEYADAVADTLGKQLVQRGLNSLRSKVNAFYSSEVPSLITAMATDAAGGDAASEAKISAELASSAISSGKETAQNDTREAFVESALPEMIKSTMAILQKDMEDRQIDSSELAAKVEESLASAATEIAEEMPVNLGVSKELRQMAAKGGVKSKKPATASAASVEGQPSSAGGEASSSGSDPVSQAGGGPGQASGGPGSSGGAPQSASGRKEALENKTREAISDLAKQAGAEFSPGAGSGGSKQDAFQEIQRRVAGLASNIAAGRSSQSVAASSMSQLMGGPSSAGSGLDFSFSGGAGGRPIEGAGFPVIPGLYESLKAQIAERTYTEPSAALSSVADGSEFRGRPKAAPARPSRTIWSPELPPGAVVPEPPERKAVTADQVSRPNYQSIAFTAAPYAEKPIVVDGDLSEWELDAPHAAVRYLHAGSKIESGPDVYFRWRAEGLYFAYKLEDPGGGEASDGAPYIGDCFELFFDAANSRSPKKTETANQHFFMPFGWKGNASHTYERDRQGAGNPSGRTLGELNHLRTISFSTARPFPGGYTVEGFLSSQAMNYRLSPGSSAALDMSVSKNFNFGDQMQWAAPKAAANWRRPDLWGDLLLLGSDAEIKLPHQKSGDPPAALALNQLVEVEIIDGDMNFDPKKIDVVAVRVERQATGDRRVVLLRETGGDTGVFQGEIATEGAGLEARADAIGLQSGDTVVFTYIDAVTATGERNREITTSAMVGWPVLRLLTKSQTQSTTP